MSMTFNPGDIVANSGGICYYFVIACEKKINGFRILLLSPTFYGWFYIDISDYHYWFHI
jgi:hypothetical protein